MKKKKLTKPELAPIGKIHGNQKHTDEELMRAIIATGGTITKAAEVFGISPRTLHRRIEDSEILQSALEGARLTRLDLINDELFKAATDRHHPQFFQCAKYYDQKHGAYIEKRQMDLTSKGEAIGAVRVEIVAAIAEEDEGDEDEDA